MNAAAFSPRRMDGLQATYGMVTCYPTPGGCGSTGQGTCREVQWLLKTVSHKKVVFFDPLFGV